MSTPSYYLIASKPSPEEFANPYLVAIVDQILGKMVGDSLENTALDFTINKVGLASTVDFSMTLSQTEDGWLVEGVKFAFDTYGGAITTSMVQAVAVAVAGAALASTGGTIMGAIVAGALVGAAGQYIWSTISSQLPFSDWVDLIANTQDVEIQYVVDGQARAGVMYANLASADYDEALSGLAGFAVASPGGRFEVYLNKTKSGTYTIYEDNGISSLARAMGVSSTEFSNWTGLDSHGREAKNGSLLISDSLHNLAYADTEASIALRVLSEDAQETEAIKVKFDNLKIGLSAHSNSGLLVVIGNDDTSTEYLSAGAHSSIVIGGAGNDIIAGSNENDRLFGDTSTMSSNGDDHNELYGYGGDDLIVGGGGGDEIHGGDGADRLYGGLGSDTIFGDKFNDIIFGDREVDTDADGDDKLAGGEGKDVLNGGGGHDILIGGDADFSKLDLATPHTEWDDGETDLLLGGAGNDEYYTYSNRIAVELPFDHKSVIPFYNQVDLIDAMEMDFTAHFQFQDYSGATVTFELTAEMVAQAVEEYAETSVYALGRVLVNDGRESINAGVTGYMWGNNLMLIAYLGAGGAFSVLGGLYQFSRYPHKPIFGTPEDDSLFGSGGADHMYGGEGSDTFYSSTGNDTYDGDANGSTGSLAAKATSSAQFSASSAELTIDEVNYEGTLSDYTVTQNSDGSISIARDADDIDTLIDIETVSFADGSLYVLSDLVSGPQDPTLISGTSGDDELVGSYQNEILNGGTGDDTLSGGAGSDIYVYASGDGNDTIADEASYINNVDVLRFTDINASDVTVAASGFDLLITIIGTGHVITVTDQYRYSGETIGIDKVEFADGSSWDYQKIQSIAWKYGTDDDDTLSGREGYQDTFVGGHGDDILIDGDGSDHYLYSSGDGSDIIRDSGGWSPEDTDVLRFTDLNASDLTFTASGSDLIIGVLSTGGTITVDRQYDFFGSHFGVEKVEFADGSSWGFEKLQSFAWINGTDSDDILVGTSNADVLNGGKGNDLLMGGAQEDVYIYSKGDGSDHINDGPVDDYLSDILHFTDLNRSDLLFQRDGSDLKISIIETGDIITVDNQYPTDGGYGAGIEGIKFADGTSWNSDDLEKFDWIIGTSQGETLTGTAGNDTLDGRFGDDLLKGTTGNDTYLWSSYDGSDQIDESTGATTDVDVLKFDFSVSPADVVLERDGDNLKVVVHLSDDYSETIAVVGQFSSGDGSNGVESIQFDDGTVWDRDYIETAPAASESNIIAMNGAASTAASQADTSAELVSADIFNFPTTSIAVERSDDGSRTSYDLITEHQTGDVPIHSADIISLEDFTAQLQSDDHNTDLWFEPEPIGALI